MNVPFRLVPRRRAEPTVAAFFPASRAADALEACCQRGLSPWGRVFATADGLLVRFNGRVDGPIPGAIRLRAIAEDLLVPVDGDLLPALLDDEIRGLTRNQGLVCLPGGRFLAYDPSSPVEPGRLIATTERRQDRWLPFPEPDLIPDRIESIELALDDPFRTAAFETLPGGNSIESSTDDDPGVSGSTTSRALGWASLGLGRSLIWLGKTLGIRPIAEQGARWVKQAIEGAPTLSELVLGRQSASLLSLLKEFREGDLERALSKALPIGGNRPDRGSKPSLVDHLVDQDTRYSLASLLGSRGGIGYGYWMGDDNLLAALAREYRKAADAAFQSGDFRRAAYIFGKLLNDFRAAANALQTGGLHRDAALVYLNRLDDRISAARAFEAAGDLDQALALYRSQNQHIEAAVLLRRMGDEEAAIYHFERAARDMANRPGGYLSAGNLLLRRAGRDDLALTFYTEGWNQRPAAGDLACAFWMLEIRTAQGKHRELLATLHEVVNHLANSTSMPEAPQFYNQIMELCPRLPDEVADEVRDRARLGLAGELRNRLASGQRAGATVSELFGHQSHWNRGLVDDADRAARHEVGRSAASRRATTSFGVVRVGSGLVTAVAAAADSGDLFLGFDNGDLFAFRASSGATIRIASGSHPIASLATDPTGTWVVAVQAGRSHSGRTRRGRIDSYGQTSDGLYQSRAGFAVDDLADPWLTPIQQRGMNWMVGLWDGQAFYFLSLPGLVECGTILTGFDWRNGPTAGLLLSESTAPAVLWHDGTGWAVAALEGAWSGRIAVDPHQPRSTPNSALRSAWLNGLVLSPTAIQIAWGDDDGGIHWRRINPEQPESDQPHHRLITDGGYRHATQIHSNLVCGLASDRLEWIRLHSSGSQIRAITRIPSVPPIACLVGDPGRIAAVVGAGGEVLRFPIPPV